MLGWGLVGASTIAREWMVDAIRSHPGNEVVAVMSADPARGREFARANNIETACSSLTALLDNPRIGAVYISTTNDLHKDQVLAAARAGKHVLCEKPLATNLADARAMVAACEQAKVVMATNHHLRQAATHRKIRELILANEIGRPLFARVFHAVYLPPHLQGWRIRDPKAGAGVILDITVHDADTLRFILGAEVRDVIAMSQQGGLGADAIEDGAMSVLRFDNGVLAQLHDAFTVKHGGHGLEVHGTEGSLIGRNCMSQRPVGEVILRNAKGELNHALDHSNLYAAVVRGFNDAIEGRASASASGMDGVRSVAVALAVLEASKSGQRVPVRYE
jgi:1,5-anhydro-D-fructose reductase (1,5-anhydro-D-mannitol-forming)